MIYIHIGTYIPTHIGSSHLGYIFYTIYIKVVADVWQLFFLSLEAASFGSLSKGQNVNKTQDAKLIEKRIIKPTILLWIICTPLLKL